MGNDITEELESRIEIDPTNRKLTAAEQYARELAEDVHLTISNLREKALTASSMKAKWVGYLAKEREASQKLSALRAEYQKSLLAKNKGANAFDKLKTANQDDETLKKIDATKKSVENSLEIITQAIAVLSEFGYNIKNTIDVVKLNNS